MSEALLAYFQRREARGGGADDRGRVRVPGGGRPDAGALGLRPLAVTLAVLAAIELAIGAGLYLRTDPQVRDLLAKVNAGDPGVYADEAARMQRVQRNFVIIEYAEIAVLLVGAFAAVAFKRQPVVVGVAIGVCINAAFLLAFDVIAERRGANYLTALERQAAQSVAR